MARISSEALAERLIDWGVDTVFGLPSDGVNGITEGLRRHQDKLKFVHVHHEEAAAFMAVAHAKMLPGHPGHGVRYPEPFADYAAFVTANGALGTKVTKPGDLRGAIQLAFNHPGPALLDVNVNPAEPPLPDKVNCEQAKNFALGFLRGQGHRAAIATTLLEDPIQQPGERHLCR